MHPLIHRKRQQDRADFSLYQYDIAIPRDLGPLLLGVPSTPYVLPGPGHLGFCCQVSILDGDVEIDVNGVRYPVPARTGPTDWYHFQWHERFKEISVVWIKGANPGFVELGVRGPTNPYTHGFAVFATAGVL